MTTLVLPIPGATPDYPAADNWAELLVEALQALNAGKVEGFADPNADRIVFWDDSAAAWAAMSVTSPLEISGTTLQVNSATLAEAIRDTMAAALVAGTNITITPNDGSDTITIAASGGGGTPPDASETVKGIIELATNAEVQTGTDLVRAVTPAGLSSRTATETQAGIAEIATAAEVSTGTDDARIVTPLKLKTQLDLKAPLASPTFTGNPTAPTPAVSDDDTTIATTAFVHDVVAAAGGGGGGGVIDPASTPYNPVLSDANSTIITKTITSDLEIVVPSNATVPYPIGTVLEGMFFNYGVTFLAASGVSIFGETSTIDTGAMSIRLIKIGTDQWFGIRDTVSSGTSFRQGTVELATNTETQTGTDFFRVVTPAGLSSRTATETRTGIAEIATTAEVTAGTDDTRIVTPLKLKSALTEVSAGAPIPRDKTGSRWYHAHIDMGGIEYSVLTAGTASIAPFLVGADGLPIVAMGTRVATAGAPGDVARFGIYADSNGLPGALIQDAGTAAIDVANTTVAATFTQVDLAPGVYWLAIVANSATATLMRTTNQNRGWTQVRGSSTASLESYPGALAYTQAGWSATTSLPATVTGTLTAVTQDIHFPGVRVPA